MPKMERVGPVSKELDLDTRWTIGIHDGDNVPGPCVRGHRYLYQCPLCMKVALKTESDEDLGDDSYLEGDPKPTPAYCDCDEKKSATPASQSDEQERPQRTVRFANNGANGEGGGE